MIRYGMIAAALLVLTGCSDNFRNIGRESDPTRFYALTPTATKPEQPLGRYAAQLVVGVGPVQVADYLERSHIVMRESATELRLAEFDRWAGDIEKEIARVIGSDLSTLLGTDSIMLHPWPSGLSPDAGIEIYVERFERDTDGKVRLVANWQVYGEGRTPLLYRRTALEKESGGSYKEITLGLSELIAELSREIAGTIAHSRPAAAR